MSQPTEEASPRRIRQARERGQIAQSRAAIAAIALAVLSASLWQRRSEVAVAFRSGLDPALRLAAHPPPGGTRPVAVIAPALDFALRQGARLSLPSLTFGAAAAVLFGALLGGFLIAPGAALPQLDRLSPAAALGRLLRPRTYLEPLLRVLESLLLLAVCLAVLASARPALLVAPQTNATAVASALGHTLHAVVVRATVAVGLFAGLDLLYRRWQHARDLRMTKEEVRREHRESEGDPETRAARDRLHRERLAEASIDRVRTASFVVTNPTHYAVALDWNDEEMDAPEVVAKGEGERARRIIEEAQRHGVAILRDAPLARSLHALELGTAIPEALYEAVAAIVSYLADGGDPEGFES